MPMPIPFVILATMVSGVVSLTPTARADDKPVKAEKDWQIASVEKKDNDAWKEAPKGGVVAGPKAWARLWKAWHGDKEPPQVDFEKEIVLVAAGPGPNILKVGELKRSDQGNLKFDWSITERGGDGFVAMIVKVKREGIKTVNGEPLPEE